jgi:hypothetical protein
MKDNYTCTLTAEGWQAYSDMKGAKAVAADLSGTLTGLVREAKAKIKAEPCLSERKLAEQIRDKMHKHLDRVSKFGFADTEPQCVLVSELETAFGLESYSLERW